jgi:hypothetical protein
MAICRLSCYWSRQQGRFVGPRARKTAESPCAYPYSYTSFYPGSFISFISASFPSHSYIFSHFLRASLAKSAFIRPNTSCLALELVGLVTSLETLWEGADGFRSWVCDLLPPFPFSEINTQFMFPDCRPRQSW